MLNIKVLSKFDRNKKLYYSEMNCTVFFIAININIILTVVTYC